VKEPIVLIDTSAWICFFARRGFKDLKQTISSLLDENRVAITGPVLVELAQGCRTEKEKRELSMAFESLHWLRITDALWYKASELAFMLRRKGITVSAMDALIASVAIQYDAYLLHRDKDYDLIAEHVALKIYR